MRLNSAAAPATVGGEHMAKYHWEIPGRLPDAATREPGNLPSDSQLEPAPAGRGKVKMQHSALIAPVGALP